MPSVGGHRKTPRSSRSLADSKLARAALSPAASQLSGIVLVALSIVVFAVNLTAQVASLHALYRAALAPTRPFNPDVASFLRTLGVSEGRYVIFNLILLVAAALASFLVSGLILWRRANDRVALLGVAMLLSVGVVGPTTLSSMVTGDFGALVPAWPWHALSQCLIWVAVFSFPLFFLLFPSGTFVPKWTRWLPIGLVPLAFLYAFFPRVFFLSSFFPARSVLVVGLSLCLIVAQTYRYRHVSTAVQRQQTKWVSLGVIGGLAINSLGTISLWLLPPLHLTATTHALFLTPVVSITVLLGPLYVGMAISRSHLWSIDVIIRRTLIYGTLTAILAAVYFGMVIGVQAVTRRLTGSPEQEPVVIVATTLLIATLFAPLRRWIQAGIDRAFYRSKYDASLTLSAFGEKMRVETDLGELSRELVSVVQEAMQPAHVTLWLRQREGYHGDQIRRVDLHALAAVESSLD